MRARAISGPWPAGDRVLALIGPDPAAEAVVRHARRLADALRAPWIALHVERTGGGDARVPMTLAAQLGAEIEVASGSDLVAAVLEIAGKRNVTQIVVGRARPPWWRRLIRRSLSLSLLRRADAFALHIVPSPAMPDPVVRRRRVPEPLAAWIGATLLVAAVVGIGEGLIHLVSQEALGMVFLAAVVAAATSWGLSVALYAAVLGFMSWNFFFIPPVYRLTIDEPRDIVAIVLFLGVAVTTGALASRVRRDAHAARSRIEGLRRIGAFSRSLGEPTTEPELLAEIARQAAGLVGHALVLTAQGEDLNIRAAEPPKDTMDEGAWAAARWAFAKQEPAGKGTGTMPSVSWRFLPMRTVRGQVGVLGVRLDKDVDQPLLQAIAALADQAAVAVERVRLAGEAARTEAQAETQKLRTALLSSLSHDLRTPLAGIMGAAGTLRTAWTALDDATREDLLRSIEEDTGRMTRFLSNIMEMTRLETGEIVPTIARVALHEVIDAAMARLPDAPKVDYDIPVDLPMVAADPMLLEQVLVNILDNSIKYAGHDDPIGLQAAVTAGRVALRITDRGIGIPPADLPHVFDSFYRARLGDRVTPGTGLGLAIARGLMDAMGGSIDAESPRPGASAAGPPGTVITLRLKIAP
jgi:two-component system sensor histidine kinase KdpD